MDSSTTFPPYLLRFSGNEDSYLSGDLGVKIEIFLSSQYLEQRLFILGDKDCCPENMSYKRLILDVIKSHSDVSEKPIDASIHDIQFLMIQLPPRLVYSFVHHIRKGTRMNFLASLYLLAWMTIGGWKRMDRT
jgi:hypothetical protein